MNRNDNVSLVAWPLALAAAATLGTLATACMMPFVAVATLAAATLDRPRAIAAVVGVWAVNQLLGFGLLGYPMTAYAASWGGALGVAGVAALFVSRRFIGDREATLASLVAAFVAGFGAYEGLLFLFSLAAGGTGTFTTSIVLRILSNDAAWLAGMSALHIVLTQAAPKVFGAPAALRLA